MDATALWISQHALTLWAVILILALLAGDAMWRRARRLRLAATGNADYLALPTDRAVAWLVLFGGLFVLLFWSVWTRNALVDFDQALAQDLHDNLSTGAQQVLAVVTNLGKPALLAAATAVIALVLALRRRWRLFVPWCVALVGTAGSGHVVKHMVQRVRPFDGHGFVFESGFSFPSGHAMMSMAFYGMLAWLLLHKWLPRHHRNVVAAAVALITVIGFSRVLLQAHFLSDVLAGYALGACWLVIGMALAERLQRGQAR